MAPKLHVDENILKLLPQNEVKLGSFCSVPSACRSLSISDTTNYNWRKWEALAWGSEIRKLMKKTGHEGYSLHGLRKNATIELLEAGCTPDEVKALTGHITTQMIEKYGQEVSKRRQANAAIVKLTNAKKNKG